MLVSEKDRDDLLSTSLAAVTRNTLRAGGTGAVVGRRAGGAGGRDTHAQ